MLPSLWPTCRHPPLRSRNRDIPKFEKRLKKFDIVLNNFAIKIKQIL